MSRRILTIISITAVALAMGAPAHAATRSPKIEGTNWFWKSQKRATPSDAHGQECPPDAPVCPDPQLQFRNPHQEGALPVEVRRGEDEKISAVMFDLSFIPSQGAKISKFTFSIVESQDSPDRAQKINAGGKKILACKITEVWTGSEDGADLWDDKPKFDCAGAVAGTPKTTGDVTHWHFNISKIAAAWGNKPDKAYGVMLVGQKPNGSSDTWSIVLKGPRRDDANTSANEASGNSRNIQGSVSYTPKRDSSGGGGGGSPDSFNTSGPGSGGFGFGPGYGTTGTTTTPSTAGTDFSSSFPSSASTPVAGDGTDLGTPGTAPASAQGPREKGPELPPVFWLMIPVALMALSVVRNVVLAPLPGKRADGVVALIRNHNAARLARPPRPDAHSPFTPFTAPLRRVGEMVRGLTRRVVSGGAG